MLGYVCMYVCMCVHMYVCMYVVVCIYVYLCVCIYLHVYVQRFLGWCACFLSACDLC